MSWRHTGNAVYVNTGDGVMMFVPYEDVLPSVAARRRRTTRACRAVAPNDCVVYVTHPMRRRSTNGSATSAMRVMRRPRQGVAAVARQMRAGAAPTPSYGSACQPARSLISRCYVGGGRRPNTSRLLLFAQCRLPRAPTACHACPQGGVGRLGRPTSAKEVSRVPTGVRVRDDPTASDARDAAPRTARQPATLKWYRRPPQQVKARKSFRRTRAARRVLNCRG